jgi:hypothetical protein
MKAKIATSNPRKALNGPKFDEFRAMNRKELGDWCDANLSGANKEILTLLVKAMWVQLKNTR